MSIVPLLFKFDNWSLSQNQWAKFDQTWMWYSSSKIVSSDIVQYSRWLPCHSSTEPLNGIKRNLNLGWSPFKLVSFDQVHYPRWPLHSTFLIRERWTSSDGKILFEPSALVSFKIQIIKIFIWTKIFSWICWKPYIYLQVSKIAKSIQI
jgi:hypothetical protein